MSAFVPHPQTQEKALRHVYADCLNAARALARQVQAVGCLPGSRRWIALNNLAAALERFVAEPDPGPGPVERAPRSRKSKEANANG